MSHKLTKLAHGNRAHAGKTNRIQLADQYLSAFESACKSQTWTPAPLKAREAMDRLASDLRKILFQHHESGMSFSDMAGIYGVDVQTIVSLHEHAKLQFAGILEDLGVRAQASRPEEKSLPPTKEPAPPPHSERPTPQPLLKSKPTPSPCATPFPRARMASLIPTLPWPALRPHSSIQRIGRSTLGTSFVDFFQHVPAEHLAKIIAVAKKRDAKSCEASRSYRFNDAMEQPSEAEQELKALVHALSPGAFRDLGALTFIGRELRKKSLRQFELHRESIRGHDDDVHYVLCQPLGTYLPKGLQNLGLSLSQCPEGSCDGGEKHMRDGQAFGVTVHPAVSRPFHPYDQDRQCHEGFRTANRDGVLPGAAIKPAMPGDEVDAHLGRTWTVEPGWLSSKARNQHVANMIAAIVEHEAEDATMKTCPAPVED